MSQGIFAPRSPSPSAISSRGASCPRPLRWSDSFRYLVAMAIGANEEVGRRFHLISGRPAAFALARRLIAALIAPVLLILAVARLDPRRIATTPTRPVREGRSGHILASLCSS